MNSPSQSPITTHVLDLARGRPAVGLAVVLEKASDTASSPSGWSEIGQARTDDDGRVSAFAPLPVSIDPGTYRLRFATGTYFAERGVASFFPEVAIVFAVVAPPEHYHVPLLLSPFGYSTYRGS